MENIKVINKLAKATIRFNYHQNRNFLFAIKFDYRPNPFERVDC